MRHVLTLLAFANTLALAAPTPGQELIEPTLPPNESVLSNLKQLQPNLSCLANFGQSSCLN